MILEHDGKRPHIYAGVRIAPNAVVCGDVTIGAGTSIGFGAVLTAESGPITIGADCVIMDTAVLRGVRRHPLTIGDNVLVGPRAYLSGCEVGDSVFVATGAAVFNGARLADFSQVRINGVVHIKTRLAKGEVVPIGWVAVGDPARTLPADRHDEIWAVQQQLDFPETVFGIDPEARRGRSLMEMMPDVMPRYARFLGRHCDDREVQPPSLKRRALAWARAPTFTGISRGP